MAIKRASHAVYELNYHFVWPPKYRKHIATKPVKEFLENLFPKVAEAYGFEVVEQNVRSDHVHLYISAPPRFAPSRVVEIMKSMSAREVFEKFPSIKKQLWGGELWSDGYFVRAVGDKVTSYVIQRYIRYQTNEQSAKQGRLF
jgi:putative transposase